MGVTGLLPALKSIQVQKHLSELAGLTLAVDAYVWLHKGVFSCATELATGKPTAKYVNYAMERIRLLRHYKIEPYIVFDGGPLPAKQGTEQERKRHREENLSRGNELAKQGKHSQARDFYVKCVDVTPQMAFQFIKALKAETVPYIVAPYEADAQLAFLERVGLVDGILTEDSDLLVFGCRQVFFKLDSVAATVISINRSDFGSITSSASDPNSISLLGWSDIEFRTMAILSGCDYLPSIPGIGLKTANSLLRKWKTAEQVVRVIALEGKKNVPRGYMDKFRLAEKCFLHQRVYDPLDKKLVHLTEPDDTDWSEETHEYVGRHLTPELARHIAEGDIDPITLLPMDDINPAFTPDRRVLRDLPPLTKAANQSNKGKEKSDPPKGGLFLFFGRNPTIPPRVKSPSKPAKNAMTGKASGKRTLGDVMDADLAAKKKKHEATGPSQSKFFSIPQPPEQPIAGPSRLDDGKENRATPVLSDDDEDGDIDSTIAQGRVELDGIDVEEPPVVEQEDGYMSPTCSTGSRDADQLSSPVNLRGSRHGPDQDADSDSEGEQISSPPSGARKRPRRDQSTVVLVEATPTPPGRIRRAPRTPRISTDLKDAFGDDIADDIDEIASSPVAPRSSPSPSPLTRTPQQVCSEGDEPSDPEEAASKASTKRNALVAAAWMEKFAHPSGFIPLQRRETNVVGGRKHRAIPLAHAHSHPYLRNILTPNRRASLGAGNKTTSVTPAERSPTLPQGHLDDVDVAVVRAKQRFERFRCPARS